MLLEKRADSALGFHRLDLVAEKFDAVKSQPGNVADGRFHVLWIDHRADGGGLPDGRAQRDPGETRVTDMGGQFPGAEQTESTKGAAARAAEKLRLVIIGFSLSAGVRDMQVKLRFAHRSYSSCDPIISPI